MAVPTGWRTNGSVAKLNDFALLSRDQLTKELETAGRYKLRNLMAQLLPYLVQDVFASGSPAAVPSMADAVLLKVILEALKNSEEPVMRRGYTTVAITRESLTSSSGKPAVSSHVYLTALKNYKWGH